jgi:hypothetical protein
MLIGLGMLEFSLFPLLMNSQKLKINHRVHKVHRANLLKIKIFSVCSVVKTDFLQVYPFYHSKIFGSGASSDTSGHHSTTYRMHYV